MVAGKVEECRRREPKSTSARPPRHPLTTHSIENQEHAGPVTYTRPCEYRGNGDRDVDGVGLHICSLLPVGLARGSSSTGLIADDAVSIWARAVDAGERFTIRPRAPTASSAPGNAP